MDNRTIIEHYLDNVKSDRRSLNTPHSAQMLRTLKWIHGELDMIDCAGDDMDHADLQAFIAALRHTIDMVEKDAVPRS